ncbi:hypothetical protein VNO80_15617 [Phaseolus coccineus]|uniref:AB hydrolase-1 domain-containing protein n=1 Tax=Phaseolus coccineus TaxID=3886 RepID=A0AAN9MQL9_PHACN
MMKSLRDLGRDTRVWALDFLGQGLSLPFEDPTPHYNKEGAISNGNASSRGFKDEMKLWATNLVYSIDLWQDQVRYFIEEVIGEPIYIVGNSLEGYVALYFAAHNPHLVKGVTFLNAKPFWETTRHRQGARHADVARARSMRASPGREACGHHQGVRHAGIFQGETSVIRQDEVIGG